MTTPADDREAFEAWASNVGLYRHHGLQIKFDDTAWEAWQAALSTERARILEPQSNAFGDLTEASLSAVRRSVPSLKRVGWVRSDEDGDYKHIISEQSAEASEYSHRDYDTPVFVELYTQDELDAARARAVELAKNLRIE